MNRNTLHTLALMTCLLAAVFCTISENTAAAEGPLAMLQPLENGSEEAAMTTSNAVQTAPTDGSEEQFVTRRGRVQLAVGNLAAQQAQGTAISTERRASPLMEREMALSFFPSQDFRVIVDHDAGVEKSTRTIRGRRSGKPISTFSMTVMKKDYVITYQDLENGMLYKVYGDAETGVGVVKEIDLSEIPPSHDLDPVVPPAQ